MDQVTAEANLRARQEFWKNSDYFNPAVERPMSAVRENTQFFDAGPVTIGVENRVHTTEMVRAHWEALGKDDPVPERNDGGPSFHVFDNSDGHEYLRFDCFRDFPHYHYFVPGIGGVTALPYDVVANGDMVEWVLAVLRSRLPAMLECAGALTAAQALDSGRLEAVLSDVEAAAHQIPR